MNYFRGITLIGIIGAAVTIVVLYGAGLWAVMGL